jgi:hypothetical protein
MLRKNINIRSGNSRNWGRWECISNRFSMSAIVRFSEDRTLSVSGWIIIWWMKCVPWIDVVSPSVSIGPAARWGNGPGKESRRSWETYTAAWFHLHACRMLDQSLPSSIVRRPWRWAPARYHARIGTPRRRRMQQSANNQASRLAAGLI